MNSLVGTILGNRYKIIDKIGTGGMADVYLAIDKEQNKKVAIKVLHRQYVNDNEFVKRFRREAQASSSLSHKNIVAIFDISEEEDMYYIVMEYVEGYTLKELLKRKGFLDVEEALDIAIQICNALDHAHENKIIHRDIKPHNILIGKDNQIKVADFGIARSVSQATITHTGSLLGSVHYLSPEQARGGWTDEKTDLYSLGVVLYEMLTGKLPFSGDTPISVVLKHLEENFVYPKEINPDIPQSVENIILKALIKNPNKRYSSAKEMLNDIETALEPDRINEPLIQVENDETFDDEHTIIIPALNDYDSQYSNQHRKIKSKKILKKIPYIFALIVIISIGLLSYQFMEAKFELPEVEIPVLEGLEKDEAISLLNDLNMAYKIVEQTDEEVENGYVIKQEPDHGTIVKATQEVTLTVSIGREQVAMPDLTDKQKNTAKFLLVQHGFNEDNIDIIESYDEETPSGLVFKQEPLSNENVVPEETRVILFVSKGKEKFEMPDLIGLSLTEAEATLLKYDLIKGEVREDYTLEQEKGRIYRQFPFDAGKEVTSGDQVDLFVSLGYPKEAKTIYGDALVVQDENKSSEVTIVIHDSRNKNITWKKEVVTGSRFYNQIDLILLPGEKGTITIYIDEVLYQQKTVYYY